MIRRALSVVVPALGCLSGSAPAATPAFDRPGIAFSTGTLPAGSIALEQGLSDFERNSNGGVHTTLYTIDSTLRMGVTTAVEVQAATSFFNQIQTRESGNSDTADGQGDASFAVKAALPSARKDFSWAALGTATFANGANQFTNGKTAYDLGTSLAFEFSEDVGAALYFNVNRLDGWTSFVFSRSLNFALSQSVAAFVELGGTHRNQDLDEAVAGGGFTLVVTPAIKLDLSADVGLTNNSPTVAAGFGVSVFFK